MLNCAMYYLHLRSSLFQCMRVTYYLGNDVKLCNVLTAFKVKFVSMYACHLLPR